MPYVRKGKTVYKKVDGLKKKGTSKTVAKAKSHRRLLEGIERGWRPTRKPRVSKRRSSVRRARSRR